MPLSHFRRCVRPLLAVAWFVLVARPASAGLRDGVGEPGALDPVPPPGPPALPRVAEVLIDFDDLIAPEAFGFTTPLRDRYLPLGVNFFGGPGTDGGAILNARSNFSVTGYSGNNFLAFNGDVGTIVHNSYIAALPELIVFTNTVAAVSIRVGSATSAGSRVYLDALNGANALLASSSLALGLELQTLRVSAPGITHVTVYGPNVMVLDDLRFTPGAVVPALARSWGRVKRLYH